MAHDERSATAVDRRLGQRVRTRRLEIGMSQERLADLLGVTFQQVQKYEKGMNRIAASRLFDIASALEMPVARFFDGLDSRNASGFVDTQTGAISDALATPEGAQLMTLFASLQSVRIRRRVVELVKALHEEAATDKRGKS